MTKEPLSFFDDQPPRPRRAADPDGPAEAVTGDPAPGTGAKHAADAPTEATPLWVAGAPAGVTGEPGADATPPPERPSGRRVVLLVALLLLGLVFAGVVGVAATPPSCGGRQPDPAARRDATDSSPLGHLMPNPQLNIVLMGTDSGPGDRGRSDSLMVLHIWRPEERLLVWFRVTWVDIPPRPRQDQRRLRSAARTERPGASRCWHPRTA
jgi:hypothetical protein